ncbi:MAG TPA: CapA family protein, partial [Candidatus Binatia bacterium]|nr:CapA family protein [Candidatus Binatia bacterium]
MGNEDKYRIYKWQIIFLVITPLFLSLVFLLMSTIRGAERVVTISAVGDTNGYNLLFDASNQADPIRRVKSLLVDSDVFLFNYEGVILPRDPGPGECHSFPRQSLFYTTPQIVNFLRPVPLAVAGIANNHILDCGSSGIRETIGALKSNGILTVGAGKDTLEACSPVLLEINGYKIAVVAYLEIRQDLLFADSNRAGAASWEECDGERQIGKLKASGRIVIVSLHLHMGRGWTESPPQPHIDLV